MTDKEKLREALEAGLVATLTLQVVGHKEPDTVEKVKRATGLIQEALASLSIDEEIDRLRTENERLRKVLNDIKIFALTGHHGSHAEKATALEGILNMIDKALANRRSEVMSENSDKTGDSVDKYVLDPCPFCSGEVFVFQAWPNRWRVGCNTNDCFTMPARHDVFFSSPEEAIKHANQRDGYWTQEDLDRAAEEAEKMMDHFGIERDQK